MTHQSYFFQKAFMYTQILCFYNQFNIYENKIITIIISMSMVETLITVKINLIIYQKLIQVRSNNQ